MPDHCFSQPFRLLAGALSPDRDARNAALQANWPDVDFPAVLELAQRHRVTPGLAHALAQAGLHPPAPYDDMVGAMLSQAAFHELAMASATSRIVQALEAGGTAPIVLKGVALSIRLHGRLGLRVSRDIDLLVMPDKVAASLALLQDLGFLPVRPFDRSALPALIRKCKDVELVSQDGRQIVELHWRLFDNPHLMPLSISPPIDRIDLPTGFSCRILEDRFNLLYLANHGAQHGWSRLKWLADFAGLAHSLGTEACIALYGETPHGRGRRALGQALLLSADLMGLPASDRLATDVQRDRRLRALVSAGRRILAGSGANEIEDIRFGSTRKNLSHYLICSDPAYLMAEIWFDLTQFPETEDRTIWHRLGPVGRLIAWSSRQVRAGPRGDGR